MNEILQAIHDEQQIHAQAMPLDLLKLAAQACFGPGHMIEDETIAYKALIQEKNQVHNSSKCQYIGNGYVRFPLSLMDPHDLMLWSHLFVESARYAISDSALYLSLIHI